MDGADGLTAIAEVAIGLAGFSGVVVVLGRQPGEFTRVETGRLVVLLLSSLGAMFFALVRSGAPLGGGAGAHTSRARRTRRAAVRRRGP